MNQSHSHDLYLFCSKGPNQLYVIFKKKFKVSEFLHVISFDTLYTSSFDTKCVHYIMETAFFDIIGHLIDPFLIPFNSQNYKVITNLKHIRKFFTISKLA